jgi:hypothetical protein
LPDAVIKIRTLAAVDIAFLGPKLILSEFALGVIGPASLGILTLLRSHSLGGLLFGSYLISLGINYVPLLVYAIRIARNHTAHAEIAIESSDRKRMFRRYRWQSSLLLLPLVVPMAAIAQEWRRGHQSSPK